MDQKINMVHICSRAASPHEPNVYLSASIISVHISEFFWMICYIYLDLYCFRIISFTNFNAQFFIH